jgi:hypothetical protein
MKLYIEERSYQICKKDSIGDVFLHLY